MCCNIIEIHIIIKCYPIGNKDTVDFSCLLDHGSNNSSSISPSSFEDVSDSSLSGTIKQKNARCWGFL